MADGFTVEKRKVFVLHHNGTGVELVSYRPGLPLDFVKFSLRRFEWYSRKFERVWTIWRGRRGRFRVSNHTGRKRANLAECVLTSI